MSKLDVLFNLYHLKETEKNELKLIIYPIYQHEEFQRRLTDEFLHHGNITLGEHILKDTIETYLLCKKKKNINISLAVKISMLHDLYTSPWQNSNERFKFFNRHGFRHPIEAAINAAYWFPDYFKNENEARIIIDGIIHHMFPLPVSSTKYDIKNTEIKNYDMFLKLDKNIQKLILESIQKEKDLVAYHLQEVFMKREE